MNALPSEADLVALCKVRYLIKLSITKSPTLPFLP